ncbi:cobalamin biosynthesis protein [Oscillospiraceae bacterium PP1C4]
MRLSIVSFTKAGAKLAEQLHERLLEDGYAVLNVCEMRKDAGADQISLSQWTKKAFEGDGIIFVGASGIAVRAIAPFVKDKLTDPAVVSIDEMGKYAVPLLSGHVGGANALAIKIAKVIGATPVISTATDLNQKFAVDVWAVEHSLCLCERGLAKQVSAALLDGKAVGLYSDFAVDGVLPDGLVAAKSGELGICVSLDPSKQPFEHTLHAVAQIVTIGIGCRRGVADDVFERAVLDTIEEHHISIKSVKQLATIDIKQNEPCICAFCEKYRLTMKVASAQMLSKVEGEFTASEFVNKITGVDNVCERAAVLAGKGRLLFKKQSKNGVTIAAATTNWRVSFGRKDGGN